MWTGTNSSRIVLLKFWQPLEDTNNDTNNDNDNQVFIHVLCVTDVRAVTAGRKGM